MCFDIYMRQQRAPFKWQYENKLKNSKETTTAGDDNEANKFDLLVESWRVVGFGIHIASVGMNAEIDAHLDNKPIFSGLRAAIVRPRQSGFYRFWEKALIIYASDST